MNRTTKKSATKTTATKKTAAKKTATKTTATKTKTTAKKAVAAKKTAPKKAAAPKHTAVPRNVALEARELSAPVDETTREGWIAAALAVPPEEAALTLPFAVLLGEAIDAVRFARAHWAPIVPAQKNAPRVPGLSSAVRRDLAVRPFAAVPTLHAGTAEELLTLHALTQQAHTAMLLAVQSGGSARDPRLSALSLLSELRALADSFLDDGVETDDDVRLAALHNAHASSPSSNDALAAALVDYAALIDSLRPGIDDYADFSPEWIARARSLADGLRVGFQGSFDPADSTLLATRNGLATLLLRRIRLVRAKARFVFREHPAVLREVTSAYERRRSADRRRAKKAAAPVKG